MVSPQNGDTRGAPAPSDATDQFLNFLDSTVDWWWLGCSGGSWPFWKGKLQIV